MLRGRCCRHQLRCPHPSLDQLPGVTVILGNTVDTDTDIPVPPGDPRCDVHGCGFGVDRLRASSMSHAPEEWTSSPFGDSPDCSTRLYVTVDLQENYPITGVTIWHYHGDDRSYCGQKVALSATGQFRGEEIVVFDTGRNFGPTETEQGNAIVFEATNARYVRHWCGPSDRNSGIHFMEMDIYGMAASVRASVDAKRSSGSAFVGDVIDHSAFARPVTLVGDSQPTASGMHFDGDGDWCASVYTSSYTDLRLCLKRALQIETDISISWTFSQQDYQPAFDYASDAAFSINFWLKRETALAMHGRCCLVTRRRLTQSLSTHNLHMLPSIMRRGLIYLLVATHKDS